MAYYNGNYKGRVSTETPEQRFNKKYLINEDTGCWEWTRATNNVGYGMFRYDRRTMRTAHRVSYEMHKGPIPQGLFVCHTCDNPKCVNPDHLWVGTRKQNYDDMVAKGRKPAPMLGRKMPLGTCKYCGVVKAVTLIGRNHNDKCKHKP